MTLDELIKHFGVFLDKIVFYDEIENIEDKVYTNDKFYADFIEMHLNRTVKRWYVTNFDGELCLDIAIK